MKAIFRTSLLICSLLVFSCKKEENRSLKEEKKLEVFQFVVDIKIKDTTDLILYYKDGANEWIVEEKAIWNTVPGEENVQSVVFNFDEDVVPNDFRFDIGRNDYKNQQPIEIKKITMNYFENSFVIDQDKINFFFKPNQNLAYNNDTKQYVLQVDENGNYDPYFETAPTIYPHIVNLVMGNSIK